MEATKKIQNLIERRIYTLTTATKTLEQMKRIDINGNIDVSKLSSLLNIKSARIDELKKVLKMF